MVESVGIKSLYLLIRLGVNENSLALTAYGVSMVMLIFKLNSGWSSHPSGGRFWIWSYRSSSSLG